MTRPLRLLTALLGAALLLAACGGDADGDLEVFDPRSRMSPMLTGVGAVYLDIANTTEVDDALLGAEVDASVAGRVEIHETFDADAGADEGTEGDAMDDGAMDDGAMDDGAMDGGAMDDGAMGDGAMDDGAMGDGAMDDGAMDDGFAMMGMREIERLEVPAGSTFRLVPGGHHLMLLDLAEDLVPGNEFDLTLRFAEAGEITVTVEVREDV